VLPSELRIAEFAFPGPLRDQLVDAIVTGAKTTTTGLIADYQHAGDPLPIPGQREIVVDSEGRPVTVIETVAVRVIRLGDVDLGHALSEGEGYTSVAEWRASHEQFWHSEQLRESLADPDFTVNDDTQVVAVEFRVVGRDLPAAAAPDVSVERNKRLVVRLIDDVWNGGDAGRLAELWDGPSAEEACALHQTLTTAFPDLHTDIEDLIAERDRVVARLSFRGTHQGEFRGIAPTGRAVRFTAIRIYRIADCKIVESWASQDAPGLLNQMQGSGG
jgi:uncharacterized protein YhfF